MSEARQEDFENPDTDTQDLLTATCEASQSEVDKYCENLVILAKLSRSRIQNEHLSSGPLVNGHDTHVKVDDQGVQNPMPVAPDSTLLPMKTTTEVATGVASDSEKMLLEAKSVSAAIWKSWVDVRATAVKGERHSKPITFAQAFENAKLIEISKKSMDTCTTSLEKLAMKAPESPTQNLPVMLPQDDQVASSLFPLVKDDSTNLIPLLQMPVSCVPTQHELPQESLMDEIGDKPGPLCKNLRPQGVLNAAVQDQSSSMAMASVIGCLAMEPTNGNQT